MENRKLTKLEIFLIIVILALLIVIHKQVIEPEEKTVNTIHEIDPNTEIDVQDYIEIPSDN